MKKKKVVIIGALGMDLGTNSMPWIEIGLQINE